ncbi:MAG: hypothetical protein GY950_19115 [bacterium]|nr:hypothetical protein [bacterium]
MKHLKKHLAAAAILMVSAASAFTVTPVSSPFTREDGMETVTAFTKHNKFVVIPVTVTCSRRKGRQTDVDAEDFPTLAKTGLHSEVWFLRGAYLLSHGSAGDFVYFRVEAHRRDRGGFPGPNR